MGIRVEHQPSGAVVGVAAYMGGAGRARERKKKQLLGLYQDERRLQARRQDQFQGFKYQVALEGMQQMGALAQQREQQDWQEVQARRMEGHQIEMQERQIQAEIDLAKPKQARAGNRARWAALPEIPEYAKPADRNFLMGLQKDIGELVNSPEHDPTDPAVQEQLDEAIDAYHQVVGQVQKPSPSEEMKRGVTYLDPQDQQFYDEPAPGRVPFDIQTRRPIETGVQTPQEQAEEKVDSQIKNLQRRANIMKAQESISGPPKGTEVPPAYTEAREEWTKRADKIMAPLESQGGGEQAKPTGDGQRIRYDPETDRMIVPPIPGTAGGKLPPLDPDTIRLIETPVAGVQPAEVTSLLDQLRGEGRSVKLYVSGLRQKVRGGKKLTPEEAELLRQLKREQGVQ